MISPKSEFKFIDRGFKETILLIPGWALDYRIFALLDLKFNYLLAILPRPSDFVEEARKAVKTSGLDKISVLGQSMGGFLATDLVSACPDMINDVTLVSVRRQYEKAEIDPVKENIRKNRTAFLYQIYCNSFSSSEKESLSYFKANLLKPYLEEMDERTLFEGLDYLANTRIKPGELAAHAVRLINGDEDKIAPVKEAASLAADLPRARFDVIKGGGHVLVLRDEFNKIFYADKNK